VGLPVGKTINSHARITKAPYLTDAEINQVFDYLREHPEINEVILSGGDPLTCPQDYLTKIINGLAALQNKGHLDVVRIGTRLPIVNPTAIQPWHYDLIQRLRNPYILLHINHPAEITPQVIAVVEKFRKVSYASMLSQTVFLQGVNDNVETLYQLFNLLHKNAIRPYYLFQNDDIDWGKHFTVNPKKAILIWQQLRPKLSGLAATARFAIDVPGGYGKIPVPEGNSWDVDLTHYRDFKGKTHQW
jgi:lysine 2,3-aminomutase